MPVSGKLILGHVHKDLAAKMLKDKGRELAAALRDALPESYSFFVVLGDGTQTAFFSDSEKDEAIRSLRAALAELEGG